MGQRRRAREFALQMLYQIDQTGVDVADVFEQFWASQEVTDEVRRFAERLVRGTLDQQERTDRLITAVADRWRVERMAVVDRNVLRIAVFELTGSADTPAAVVIDEAIEVAKRFGSEDSGKFINGILDAVRQRLESGSA